jgi:hypothetical protein
MGRAVTIYGDAAGFATRAFRLPRPLRQVAGSAGDREDPNSPRPGLSPASITVDIVRARPIHLAIIDGIETQTGGEGGRRRSQADREAGVLIAGLNLSRRTWYGIMGFPAGRRGQPPPDMRQHARLAEEAGSRPRSGQDQGRRIPSRSASPSATRASARGPLADARGSRSRRPSFDRS